jgi:GH25 family lysozyme M1 (1,4-beta-N-acetylmuramidase)
MFFFSFQKNVRRAAALFIFLIVAANVAFAQRPLGTDVSHYQSSVNWTTVKNAGVTFAWAKATEGNYYTDPTFVSNETGAKNAGVFIGAYHFARPSVNTNLTGINSADTEAAYFWSVTSNYVKGGSTYMVPMLDWEDTAATNGHGGFNGFTTSFMSAWVNQWCNTVSNYAKAAGVTLRPIIYTGTWYSNPSGGYAGLNATVTGWPLWVSSYNGQNVQTGGPTSTFPWSTWTIWQYDDANPYSGGDSDVLNGVYTNLDALVIGGLSAPYLVSQPVNHRATDTGGSVTFTAGAGGNTPLNYRWLLNNTVIASATNSTLIITNAQTTNSGFYALIVTNASGSVTSSPVSLLVYPQQTTVFADNFDTDTTTNWILNNSSSDNAVTFNFDYSTLGIPSAPNSLNGSTRGVQMKANLTLGVTNALSLSPTNQSFGGDYRLHFDAWINVNGPFPAGGAGSTELLTAGVGTSGTRTQWIGRNSTADGYYFSVDGDGGAADTTTTTADYNAYAGTTVQLVATGDYWAGMDTTARGNGNNYYTTAFPNGAAAPALQQANYPQQSGSLNNGTFGFAWHDVIVSKRGNTVDWVVDGIRLATISNATFTASNVFVGFWDPFPSLSSNNIINFGLVDNVRVESPALLPAFTLQPVAQTVKLGTNVTFTAAASGLPSPNYQWRLNNINLPGATNASYTLAFVAATNTGNYSVLATNIAGVLTSTNAALTLVAPAAAQFSAIVIVGDAVQITFTGDAYWSYTIETSTNLTSWSDYTNLTSLDGSFSFTTGSMTNAPQQFFRARVGP